MTIKESNFDSNYLSCTQAPIPIELKTLPRFAQLLMKVSKEARSALTEMHAFAVETNTCMALAQKTDALIKQGALSAAQESAKEFSTHLNQSCERITNAYQSVKKLNPFFKCCVLHFMRYMLSTAHHPLLEKSLKVRGKSLLSCVLGVLEQGIAARLYLHQKQQNLEHCLSQRAHFERGESARRSALEACQVAEAQMIQKTMTVAYPHAKRCLQVYTALSEKMPLTHRELNGFRNEVAKLFKLMENASEPIKKQLVAILIDDLSKNPTPEMRHILKGFAMLQPEKKTLDALFAMLALRLNAPAWFQGYRDCRGQLQEATRESQLHQVEGKIRDLEQSALLLIDNNVLYKHVPLSQELLQICSGYNETAARTLGSLEPEAQTAACLIAQLLTEMKGALHDCSKRIQQEEQEETQRCFWASIC
jgi:hypothetical protein